MSIGWCRSVRKRWRYLIITGRWRYIYTCAMHRKIKLRWVWWTGDGRRCVAFWKMFSVTFNKDQSKHNNDSDRPQNNTNDGTCRETTLVVVIFWFGGVGWNITASWGSRAYRIKTIKYIYQLMHTSGKSVFE